MCISWRRRNGKNNISFNHDSNVILCLLFAAPATFQFWYFLNTNKKTFRYLFRPRKWFRNSCHCAISKNEFYFTGIFNRSCHALTFFLLFLFFLCASDVSLSNTLKSNFLVIFVIVFITNILWSKTGSLWNCF